MLLMSGLKKRKDLNGTKGVVESFNKERRRYKVMVKGKERLLLRSNNFEKVK